jgi:pyruvate/2-oxoglutarate dehydrogenase complex dihydrolipoamide acyltransferase (E2) component
MKVSVKLGRYGMSMEEATIARWCVAPGQGFAAGDPIYEIETDKVTQAVEAEAPGTLLEIRVAEGDVAQVGDVVCVVDVAI